jgi:hypothetical protein
MAQNTGVKSIEQGKSINDKRLLRSSFFQRLSRVLRNYSLLSVLKGIREGYACLRYAQNDKQKRLVYAAHSIALQILP